MSYTYNTVPIISANNSSNVALGIANTFTGNWDEVWSYGSISVLANTNVIGTLYADFSTDGISVDRAVLLNANSNNLGIHQLTPVAKYMRVRVVNGANAQSYMYLQTIYNNNARVSVPTSRMGQALSNYSDVLNVRSAVVGSSDSGYWDNVGITTENELHVAVLEPHSAFGEVATYEPFPVVQADFIYGINTQLMNTANTGSGYQISANSVAIVGTNTATSSSSTLITKRSIKYRPGQGGMARYTAAFTTGAANSKQYAGFGHSDLSDGVGFGYNGTQFGIYYINNGTETWVPQSSWNIDVCDGSLGSNNKSGILLDPTKGNVYEIKFQYLGFGAIFLFVENSDTGGFAHVHTIRYANLYTVTNFRNPSMSVLWKAINTTNNTDISVRAGSCAIFIEGQRRFLGPKRSFNNNKTSVTTQQGVIFIQNATTYNGTPNRSVLRLRKLSVAASVNNPSGIATFRLLLNPTVTSVTYAAIDGTTADNGITITNGNSIASTANTGTITSQGTQIYNIITGINNNSNESLEDYDIILYPGDVLAVTGESTQSCSVAAALAWVEDI